MNRKVIISIMIVIGSIALTYIMMPDLIVGIFDDWVLAVLAVCAEVALFIVQAAQIPRIQNKNSKILVINRTIGITHIQIVQSIRKTTRIVKLNVILIIKKVSFAFLLDVLLGNKLNHDTGI